MSAYRWLPGKSRDHLMERSLCDLLCWIFVVFFFLYATFCSLLTCSYFLLRQKWSLQAFCSLHFLLVSNVLTAGTQHARQLAHWLFQPVLPLFCNVFLLLLWGLLVQRTAILKSWFVEFYINSDSSGFKLLWCIWWIKFFFLGMLGLHCCHHLRMWRML